MTATLRPLAAFILLAQSPAFAQAPPAMIRPLACPAPARGSYGVTPPPTSITLRGSVPSAARRPASSYASTMRSVKGATQRAMGSRDRPASPASGCKVGRGLMPSHGPRPADKYAHGYS
jgi:hypothetical protein